MRIKINDKIYRLKEIESGVDSLMELVEEPKYKDGDFVVNKAGSILIFKEKVGDFIYDHAYLASNLMLFTSPDAPTFHGINRHATEEEKQKMLDALAERGKRWNTEKKCIEDIPKRKFKKGDKVRIKHGVSSKTHYNAIPAFVGGMDKFIGKELTIENYSESGFVTCDGYYFSEDWLEPYVEDIPKRKFKVGDKVALKSGCKKTDRLENLSDGLEYFADFDRFIGKPLTIKGYAETGSVYFYDCPYFFEEEWLEPYAEELKKGDFAIFWDYDQSKAYIGVYNQFYNDSAYPHENHSGNRWKNAIKFESMEQYEKLLKGEI